MPINDYSGIIGVPTSSISIESKNEIETFFKNNGSSKVRIGGGLTGVNGSAVPSSNEVYLDTRKLNKTLWFDKDAGVLITECGTTIQELQTFCETAGWRFPIVPGSSAKATIGGLVSFNGGSSFSHKLGKIEDYVLGIEAVLTDGETIFLGSHNKKVSEGPLFYKSIIGSEGTLCFIYSIVIKCIPMEKKVRKIFRLESNQLNNILDLLPVLSRLNCDLIEVADKNCMDLIGKGKKAVCWVLGNQIEEISLRDCTLTVHDESILEERYSIGFAIANNYKFFDYDICFPLKHTAAIIDIVKSFSSDNQIQSFFFGHAGDGNWHVHFVLDNFQGNFDSFLLNLDNQLSPFFCQISGEHGIGRTNKNRFINRRKDIDFKLYKALKNILDPNAILPSLYEF